MDVRASGPSAYVHEDAMVYQARRTYTNRLLRALVPPPQALEDKRESLDPLMSEIDALDSQMGALEAMLERLDAAADRLNGRIAESSGPNAAA